MKIIAEFKKKNDTIELNMELFIIIILLLVCAGIETIY